MPPSRLLDDDGRQKTEYELTSRRDRQVLEAMLSSNARAVAEHTRHAAFTWDSVLRLAMQEAVLPAIGWCMHELGCEANIPQEISTFLVEVERLNAERNEAIMRETSYAVGLLNEIGICPVLLKGPACIAAGVYPNVGARYMEDADLLIAEDEIAPALSALARHGFVSDTTDPLQAYRHHAPPMQRPASVSIELHHSLVTGKYASLLPASEVLQSALPCDLGGVNVRVPSPEHLASHVILHSQIRHSYNERIWPSLRSIFDLVLIDRRFRHQIDWKMIERRFKAAGQHGVFVLYVMQAADELGWALPLSPRRGLLLTLRQARRELLRTVPQFRFADPIYIARTALQVRGRTLSQILGTRHGWRTLLEVLKTRGPYVHVLSDIGRTEKY